MKAGGLRSGLTGAGFLTLSASVLAATVLVLGSGPLAMSQLRSATDSSAKAAQIRAQVDAANPAHTDTQQDQRLAAYTRAIPPGPDLDSALSQVRASATSTGATWTSTTTARSSDVAVDVAGQPRQLISFVLTVTVQCDRIQLSGALAALVSQPRLTVVDAVSHDGKTAVITAHVYAQSDKDTPR